jgi:hypothetical protein
MELVVSLRTAFLHSTPAVSVSGLLLYLKSACRWHQLIPTSISSLLNQWNRICGRDNWSGVPQRLIMHPSLPLHIIGDVALWLITRLHNTTLCQQNGFQSERTHKKILVFCVLGILCATGDERSLNCAKRLLASSWLPLEGFSWNLILDDFPTICRENPSFIKIWHE